MEVTHSGRRSGLLRLVKQKATENATVHKVTYHGPSVASRRVIVDRRGSTRRGGSGRWRGNRNRTFFSKLVS
jgi:hypothetical protein